MANDKISRSSLSATIKTVDCGDKDLEIVVRISNKSKRALHYISSVRVTKYDPASKTLTVCLSDEGREVIASTVDRLPAFRFVDPESDAEVQIRIPNRIVKLSRDAPPGELAFESHQLSDAESVVVEIAWADVPYYVDTRKKDDTRLPATRWEQHKATTKKRLRR